MRHAHHDFVDVVIGGALEQFFEDRNGGFGAFQREALLSDEAGVQEMLELFGFEQMLQDAHARLAVERPVVGLRLHAVLQPALLLRMLDVHVLAADLAAISLAQRFQDFAQRGHGLGAVAADGFAQVPVRNSRSRSQMVRP